jgi:hypothetical protein
MKALNCLVCVVFAGLLHVNAQRPVLESNEDASIALVSYFNATNDGSYQFNVFSSNEDASIALVSYFNATDDGSYQFNVFSYNKAQFTCVFNVRVEDELTSEETYKWFKHISFFDVNFYYTFKAFELNMTIENLLGVNNNNFAIEHNVEKGIGNMQNILFTHEADFLVSARIAYNF